jgi:hypothetical protein
MVKVYYNGENPFDNIAPTPFVSISDEMIRYGDRFGVTENITLVGNITGQCQDFNFFINKQNLLLQKFGVDFKPFAILQNGEISPVYSGNFIKVDSVDFEQSNYNGILPFSISLTSFPSGFFTGVYGVLDPSDNTRYAEQQDGTVAVLRDFSARGFNTNSNSNNALNNAINYVKSLTGNSPVAPKFITAPSAQLVPRQISETVNRMESSYSVSIEYVYRKNATSQSILSYSIDINYDEENGIYNVGFDGSIVGPIGMSMATLRSNFASLQPNIFNIVLTRFRQITNYQYLNSIPTNFNISENALENTINFNYSYISDPYSVKFDKNISLNYDYTTDLYTLNFNGTLTSLGSQKSRMTLLENELSKIDIKSIAQNFFQSKVPGGSPPLNPNYKNYDIKKDITNPQITISAQFDNTPIPPPGFKTFNYNISINPSFYIHNPVQLLNGDNGVFKMNFYKRGQISVQGQASFSTSVNNISLVKSEAEKILNTYAIKIGASRRLRIQDNIERDIFSTDNGYSYTFTLTETCESNIFTI